MHYFNKEEKILSQDEHVFDFEKVFHFDAYPLCKNGS